MKLGERIKTLREKVGITQEDLAEKMGVQRNTVWRWENQKANLTANNIRKLATVLNVDSSELIESSNTFPIKIHEADGSNNMVVLSLGGDKSVKAPATQDGYAFLERLFLASLKAQVAAV